MTDNDKDLFEKLEENVIFLKIVTLRARILALDRKLHQMRVNMPRRMEPSEISHHPEEAQEISLRSEESQGIVKIQIDDLSETLGAIEMEDFGKSVESTKTRILGFSRESLEDLETAISQELMEQRLKLARKCFEFNKNEEKILSAFCSFKDLYKEELLAGIDPCQEFASLVEDLNPVFQKYFIQDLASLIMKMKLKPRYKCRFWLQLSVYIIIAIASTISLQTFSLTGDNWIDGLLKTAAFIVGNMASWFFLGKVSLRWKYNKKDLIHSCSCLKRKK